MKHLFILLFCLIQTCDWVQAQIFNKIPGAQNSIFLGSSTTLESGFSSLTNPSLVDLENKWKVSFFQEVPYLLKETQVNGLELKYRFKEIPLGFVLIQSGNSFFNQQQLGLSLSKKLSPDILIGINGNFLITNQFQTNTLYNFQGGLGLFYQYSSKLSVGITILNLTRSSYQLEKKERLPSLIRMGILYQLTDGIKLTAEKEFFLESTSNLRIGLQNKIAKKATLNFGFAVDPRQYALGIGYQTKTIKWLIGCSYSQILGLSPVVGCEIKPGK